MNIKRTKMPRHKKIQMNNRLTTKRNERKEGNDNKILNVFHLRTNYALSVLIYEHNKLVSALDK